MQLEFDKALTLARAGDQAGFSAIFAELAGPVVRYLTARAVEDPEGLTNEVFLSAFRGLASFDGGADELRGWIFTITRNKAIDDARRRSRRPQRSETAVPERPTGDVEAEVLERLESEWVDEQFAALTEDQREVLVLRLVSDLTIAEVSRIVGKPIDAVKALQRRGLRRLGKEIPRGTYPFGRDRR